ncbi:hypothetical protein BpHYR1_043125 [Brachionus plicatilis]|uniref:Uncharacterized protein n=1 Tax=Brachionus plicatilis TaxID=10195 RepID=A0A3M7QZA7_BRAPC|nr:hypothetical protein BpHYR1_043125 [Brachionus plicatilis]
MHTIKKSLIKLCNKLQSFCGVFAELGILLLNAVIGSSSGFTMHNSSLNLITIDKYQKKISINLINILVRNNYNIIVFYEIERLSINLFRIEYVQDKISEHWVKITDLVLNKRAHVYVCGRKALATEVIDSFKLMFQREKRFESRDQIENNLRKIIKKTYIFPTTITTNNQQLPKSTNDQQLFFDRPSFILAVQKFGRLADRSNDRLNRPSNGPVWSDRIQHYLLPI